MDHKPVQRVNSYNLTGDLTDFTESFIRLVADGERSDRLMADGERSDRPVAGTKQTQRRQ